MKRTESSSAVRVGIAAWLLLVSCAAAGVSADRYQVEVDAGDVEALDRLRVEIQRSIAVVGAEGSERTAAQRYDWAYLNWRLSQALRSSDRKRSKSLLKEAERQLDLVLELEPENAEAYALRGSAIGDRIGGAFSGAMLGRRASANLDRAFELGSENPRVALLRGIGYYFTPRTFGGGKENADGELRRALELFGSEAEDKAWPSWGHADALAWLGVLAADRGAVDEARELYDRALELQPANRWIRDELVPALGS